MISNPEKSWEWSNKIRNASLLEAERMVAESAIDTKKKVGQVRSFSQFFILKFACRGCHKNHFWGGTKKYTMSVDFRKICPKRHPVRLIKKYDNVPRNDAMHYAPGNIRCAIEQDEYQEAINPFLPSL